MKIQSLFDIDKYIKVNDVKEVTSQQIYSSPNVFNDKGIFSEDIFGQLPEERDVRCGYILLPIYVFNPNIAKTIITKSGGIIRKMAYAEVKCNIIEGILTPSDDGKYTGLKDLYDIWDEINIEKTLKTNNANAVKILSKTPKRLLFNNKLLVLPPNFRRIGVLNGRAVKSELNSLYISILGIKSVISHVTSNSYQIYNKLQNAVINIYTYINAIVSTKNGFFQKNLLAKTTARTVRNVISAPHYNTETPEIGIFTTGYPLHTISSLFNPMVKFQMKQFLSPGNIQNIHPNPNEVKPSDLINIYDDKMIDDLLSIYMKNPAARFDIMYLDPLKTKPIIFEAFNAKKNQTISRPMTLTDVVYLCSYNAVVKANKMVYTVRYPIGDYLGAFFTHVHLLSTIRTVHIQYMGEDYKTYPDIDLSSDHMKVSISFEETIHPSNSRLKAICGDYDGDTVKSIGIWSDEANEQAEKLMYSKIYNITPQCTTVYDIGIECLNGLYSLTKMNNS